MGLYKNDLDIVVDTVLKIVRQEFLIGCQQGTLRSIEI